MTGHISGPDATPDPRRLRPAPPPPPPPPPPVATRASGTAPMARDQVAIGGTTWHKGRDLAEAKNAHSTNTKEDFEHALKHGYNWLEGDIRTEINEPFALEMRHDKGHESGDNLTLEAWLTRGKASGRGLKLDVKEGERIGEILELCERVGVPAERLMFNLGDGDMAKWGAEIRRRFPDAQIAVNPTDELGGEKNEGPLADWQVDRMIALQQETGSPTTFVVRYDRLTDEAIERLSAHGTISVWNSPAQGGVDDVAKLTRELRLRGVDGVIDLRASMDWKDKAGVVLDKGKNLLRDGLDRIF